MASLVRTRLGARAVRSFGTSSRVFDSVPSDSNVEAVRQTASEAADAVAASASVQAQAESRGQRGQRVLPLPAEQPQPLWGRGQLGDVHTPIYKTHAVPRRPSFPTMPDAPLHKHVNFPLPFLEPPPADLEPPETLGEDRQEKQLAVLGAITGLNKGELRGLHRFTGKVSLVAHQTKKGKM